MKTRVTVTLDPGVVRRAKTVARSRRTNLSALIEDLLKHAADHGIAPRASFTQKWAGKLTIRESNGRDELLDAMKARYDLDGR